MTNIVVSYRNDHRLYHQEYISSDTSINSTKLPAIYKKIDWGKFREMYKTRKFHVLDYGCGKYIDHIRDFVEKQGGYYFPYDRFNGYDIAFHYSMLEHGFIDIIICSNVLNTIKEPEIVKLIHDDLFFADTAYFITVYEGDRSGIGKPSKKNCWQRHQKIKEYINSDYDEVIRKEVICGKRAIDFLL